MRIVVVVNASVNAAMLCLTHRGMLSYQFINVSCSIVMACFCVAQTAIANQAGCSVDANTNNQYSMSNVVVRCKRKHYSYSPWIVC